MSYSDFINQFRGVISSFVSWLSMVANSLMSNYFFITFLGITIFLSLFWLLYNAISYLLHNLVFGYDEYNDLYENYVLKKQVQSDYLDNHYEDEFDYRYRSKLLSLQVMNGLYTTQKDLIVDNKISNMNANIEALKKLKEIKLVDDDDTNDNDVDMLVANPPIQLSNIDELKKKKNPNIFTEYPNLSNDIEVENGFLIKNISDDYSKYIVENYTPLNDTDLVNNKTGEVIDRYIYDGNYKMYDLYNNRLINESDYIDMVNNEIDLKHQDFLDREGL